MPVVSPHLSELTDSTLPLTLACDGSNDAAAIRTADVGVGDIGIGIAAQGSPAALLVNLFTDMFPAWPLRRRNAHRGSTALPRPDLGAEMLRIIAVRSVTTAAGATVAWTIVRFTGTRRRASTMGLAALVGSFFGCVPLDPIAWFVVVASSVAATAAAVLLATRTTTTDQALA